MSKDKTVLSADALPTAAAQNLSESQFVKVTVKKVIESHSQNGVKIWDRFLLGPAPSP